MRTWLTATRSQVGDEVRTARLVITRMLRIPLADLNAADLARIGQDAEQLIASINRATEHHGSGR